MNSPSPTAILQWIGSAALLFCSGCATTTNGAWYHQSDDGANSLYFTFIYKGPDVELLGATINGERARGWQCEPKASSSDGMTGPAPTIHPGQLVVLWLPESPKVACEITVPIDAKLRLRKSGHRESSVKIEVSTSLPSALPESWASDWF